MIDVLVTIAGMFGIYLGLGLALELLLRAVERTDR